MKHQKIRNHILYGILIKYRNNKETLMCYNEIVNKYDGNFSVRLSPIDSAIKSFKKFRVSETAECPSVSTCIKYP